MSRKADFALEVGYTFIITVQNEATGGPAWVWGEFLQR